LRAERVAMVRSFFVRLVATALVALALAGCWKSESYRYKLTLAVNTPAGVKRGSSVVEVLFWDVIIPARGTARKLRGQALYLDLGPGAKPLIALLTAQLYPKYGKAVRWSRDAGPGTQLMCRLYGLVPSADYIDDVPRIARLRGRRQIIPSDLPDLVTFADIDNPKSVIVVDPNNLQATLGLGVSWSEITLESTDEPITKGIEGKLPWLPAYYARALDGDHFSRGDTLANALSTFDFDQIGN
jgi:hypothetical protein